MSTIKITAATPEETTGTGLRGYVTASYKMLVHTFGEPTYRFTDVVGVDQNKTDAEWDVIINGHITTIYNWKNGQAYLGATAPATEEIMDWNIGGSHSQAEYLVKRAIESGVRIQE